MLTVFPARKLNDSAFRFYDPMTWLYSVFSNVETNTIKNFVNGMFQILQLNLFWYANDLHALTSQIFGICSALTFSII